MFRKLSTTYLIPIGLFSLAVAGCTEAGDAETGTANGSDTSTSTGTGTGTEGEGGSDGNAESGLCAYSCNSVADCGPAQEFNCTEGFCEYLGCTPGSCPGDLECAEIDGFPSCIIPCEADDACSVLGELACAGVSDGGGMFCIGEGAAFECTPSEPGGACMGFGVCNDAGTACICNSDEDCSEDNYACKG